MSATAVTVPDIGDFKSVPVTGILVRPGDYVEKDAPLVVLESDKATLDVPSPLGGVIKELKIVVGDRVSVGSLLLTMDVAPNVSFAPVAPVAVTRPSAPPPAPPTEVMSDKVILLKTPEDANQRRAEKLPELHRLAYASPSVRRICREFGIDIGTVRGTGPRGRILKGDLQCYVKERLAAPPDAPQANPNGGLAGLQLPSWPQIDFAKLGSIERTHLSKIRRLSGANLARNHIIIPHVTNFEDADITGIESFRRALNTEAKSAGPKLTVLPFLIKAAATVLARYPTFNSSLDGDELILKRYFHIGFAVDTPNGLVVPVIRDVDRKGIREITTQAAALATLAQDGKLKPADLQGGCFTVSSLGGIGGTGFTPIINAPEVAILGVARAQTRPVWNGKEFCPRLILPLSLSWDHRVVDGVAAARFLVALSELLGDFRRVLL
jgi:pyruvate dehydrogenase E2 component (dihydrolipoamide acetyltransferase)